MSSASYLVPRNPLSFNCLYVTADSGGLKVPKSFNWI